ncbi:immunoglobulin-like domain-containing protein [Winogradskyella sp.]|uniref:immunoglobulin-like domain-containing protein n=1 Tax=Winogradskyella sp. TaxID=1883156 RepID=UPI0025D38CA6|nr:immunoglobulin-like domain-containing protein [Winogradskyella sp.]
MRKILLIVFALSVSFAFAQNSLWQKQTANSFDVKESRKNLPKNEVYSLNLNSLKSLLSQAPKRGEFSGQSNVIVSFPNEEGQFERFRIVEASVMHPELAARYPGIKSYAGQGVDDPADRIRFSVSPLGLQSMRLSSDKPASFIEPYTNDLSQYAVYKRQDKQPEQDSFECEVTAQANSLINGDSSNLRNADDGTLRTYRLAVSTTGEYTSYHGGTKALALAAINTTMTRVNGIFENDFNVTMVLIANTDDVIYTNASTDPYSNGSFNSQVQSTLTSIIGEANYDVGHLFARASDNGNAGCIGCVCVNGQKGSAFTSRSTPEGDPFDVDYVAHELGHQFGGNHTFSFRNEGTNAHFEPGSGTTIMGYAGITGATDVQQNSDPYFHWFSIQQVTNYVKTTSCQTNTNTGNAVPTVNAGPNYTIPRGTPFVLEGTASDADPGDVLTYCWEQADENNAATTYPSTTATTGVAFRSFNPTTDNKRYFPRLSTVKTGATSWQWEAVPNVARTLNFRLTVRDNRAGGATNNSDDVVITVNGTAGPFVVNSPNTNVTWNAGTTQTVTWDVAGTTGNGVNASTVDIFLSTDGGDTYPIALASNVPNDGSHDILVPNNQGNQNRIMVKGNGNVFFDISNSNFTIAGQVNCNATTPTGLSASAITDDSATLSWDAVPGASYDLRYRQTGTSTWTTIAVNGISSSVTGLSALTEYEAQVRSRCPDSSTSSYSSSIVFTTLDVQLNYCSSQSSNVNDEFISRVQLNTIDNSSGAQFYSDFTSISTTLTKETQYTVTITPTWTGTLYNEGYSVWIDYNRDGDFTDAGEQVFTQTPTQATPVSGSFTVPAGATEAATRMRVTLSYNANVGPCDSFTYGEVEDYTIIIEGSGPDTTPPVITLNGSSTVNLDLGQTYNEQGATATDNVDGDISANIVIGGDTVNTNVAGTYVVTYNVSDAAGNAATEVTRTVNVNADTTAPVITLNGSSTVNLNIGDTYNELGATATDNVDGDISANIVVGGDTVNTSIAGTYIVTYNVSDAAGNAATQVTRTVNVNPDTTAPVITLIGASTINLTVGDTYTEQGATASDNIDGDISANIVIGGDIVNTGVAGTYVVTYNVSDAAGNAATQVTRTVNVSEPSNGCSGGITTFPYSEGFEGGIGAWTQSSADDLDWLVDANGTPSNNTGPSSAIEGSNYIYVEASVNGTGYPNKRAIITSPCFDLSGLSTPSFSFNYHMFGAADMGSIDLEVSDDEGASWTSLWNQTGNQGNQWLSVDIDLSAYTGSSIQLRFNRFVGSTWQADIAIDNIRLEEPAAPTCSDGIQNGDETGVDCGGSFCAPCSTSNVILNEGFFETGFDGWIDGGSDCARVNSANSFEGNFSIRIRDNSGVASSMTLSNIDVTSFTSVEVDFYFYVFSMENGEDFWLRFFDGSTWSTVQTWTRGVDIDNNTFYNATVTITPAQYNFAVNSGFRFQNDASGNQDQIFIDQVTITGISGSSKGNNDKLDIVGYRDSVEITETDIRLYPNPATGGTINVSIPYLEDEFSYSIVDIQGKTVSTGKSEGIINVSNLNKGMYFIKVNDGDEIITKKFIKN